MAQVGDLGGDPASPGKPKTKRQSVGRSHACTPVVPVGHDAIR